MQRCLGVIIHNIEGQFPYGGCLNTLILLTPKAGLGRPDVEMRVVGGGGAHAAAHPFQQRPELRLHFLVSHVCLGTGSPFTAGSKWGGSTDVISSQHRASVRYLGWATAGLHLQPEPSSKCCRKSLGRNHSAPQGLCLTCPLSHSPSLCLTTLFASVIAL